MGNQSSPPRALVFAAQKLALVSSILLLLVSSTSTKSQACVSLPDGLAGWWEGENNASDYTEINPGDVYNGLDFAGGIVNQAFNFDGVDDYIRIPASPSMNVGSGDGFTIECWIYPTDVSRHNVIAEWNDDLGNIGVHFVHSDVGLGGLGSLMFNVVDVNGADHRITSPAGQLNTQSFQHVAVTFDKDTGQTKLFHNGAIVASQQFGSFTPQTTYDLYFGKRASGSTVPGSYFAGLMDEIALFNRALTDEEVLAIYQAGASGKCTSNPPVILKHPSSQTVTVGANAEFSVQASGAALTYQWRFNNLDIEGATTSALSRSNVQTNDSGAYSVVVSNLFGFEISSNAILSVISACVSADPGLVSWWPAENNANDYFGGNNGTGSGSLTFGQGKIGTAFEFNGVDTVVNVPASAALDVGAGDGVTFECWIRPTNLTSSQIIAEWNNEIGSIGVHFVHSDAGLGGLGSLMINLVDTSGSNHRFSSPPNTLVANTFQHVAFTYNRTNGSAKVYRNGSQVGSGNFSNLQLQTTYPLFFGKRPSGAGGPATFKGLIDEVAIYNRALSDAEILGIFNAGTNGKSCTPPQIVVQPQSQTISAGSNVTFSASVVGTAPLHIQWFKNGTNLPGATNVSLTLSNAQPSNAGTYSLRVTNALGFAISSNAVLEVRVVTVLGNGVPLTNSVHSFNGSVTVQLQSAYTNGLIFYTTDGSIPSFTSDPYNGPFLLSHSSTLRAIGYSADFFNSGESAPILILIVPSYPLTTTSPGGGTISVNPSGSPYLSNTVVTLTALPNPGWTFLQWLGDASGNNSSNPITMNSAKSVQAIFGTTLSSTVAGNGSLFPAGGVFPYGTTLKISAVPQVGSYFALWGNAASGNTNPLTFTITNANPTVSSLFSPVSGGQAALTVVPVGFGQIGVSPRSNVYSIGEVVAVTAMPASAQSFLGWSGDAAGNQNPLSVTMDGNKLIYANFTKRAQMKVSPPSNENGIRLTINGDFGVVYDIEISETLTNWTTLKTITNVFGTSQFTDFAITNMPRRYYRAKASD